MSCLYVLAWPGVALAGVGDELSAPPVAGKGKRVGAPERCNGVTALKDAGDDLEVGELANFEDRAAEWLGETNLRFNEVLKVQRGKVIDTGRARGWTKAQIRECMRRICGVYDEAMQEEVECAKRLFGETATREAVRRHDIAAR